MEMDNSLLSLNFPAIKLFTIKGTFSFKIISLFIILMFVSLFEY